jgi:hypothetical protein
MRVTVGPTLVSAIGILLLTLRTAHTQGVVLPLPPEDQQKISAQLGTGVVGKPLPSEPIEDVSVYFPLRERAYTFQVISGRSAGKSQRLALVKARLPSGEVAWRFQLSPSLISFIGPSRFTATLRCLL